MARLLVTFFVFYSVCGSLGVNPLHAFSHIHRAQRNCHAALTDVVDLKSKITVMEAQMQQMNETMFTMFKLNAAKENATLEELTSRMDTTERNIDVMADQQGIELTDTELNRFLGNTEAQLVDLQMDPNFDIAGIPTISPETFDDMTVEQADLLGGALYTINKQNEKLASQVVALQHEISEGRGVVSRQPETDLIQNRLNKLERIVVSQSAAKSGSQSKNTVGVLGGRVASAGHDGVSTDVLNEDEEEALQGIFEDVRGGAVSLFSVARTGSMLGQNRHAQPVPYETQFASKGGVYHSTNGTFVCNIPGYYFITFTARTYDQKYLGINLMKNEESLTAVYSDKHGRNVMQTQSIIIHLGVDDSLWLRMPPSNKFAIHSDQYHLSTFTGFLVYPGDP